MRSITSEKTVHLRKIFSLFGLPLSITTDNGPQFVIEVFATYMHKNQIHHRRITQKWPQANGVRSPKTESIASEENQNRSD